MAAWTRENDVLILRELLGNQDVEGPIDGEYFYSDFDIPDRTPVPHFNLDQAAAIAALDNWVLSRHLEWDEARWEDLDPPDCPVTGSIHRVFDTGWGAEVVIADDVQFSNDGDSLAEALAMTLLDVVIYERDKEPKRRDRCRHKSATTTRKPRRRRVSNSVLSNNPGPGAPLA